MWHTVLIDILSGAWRSSGGRSRNYDVRQVICFLFFSVKIPIMRSLLFCSSKQCRVGTFHLRYKLFKVGTQLTQQQPGDAYIRKINRYRHPDSTGYDSSTPTPISLQHPLLKSPPSKKSQRLSILLHHHPPNLNSALPPRSGRSTIFLSA